MEEVVGMAGVAMGEGLVMVVVEMVVVEVRYFVMLSNRRVCL